VDSRGYTSVGGPPCAVVGFGDPAANCGPFFARSASNIGGGPIFPRGFGITLPRGRQIGATLQFKF
ncbi:MAG: hypothetical protein VW103_10235, partial [Halieaceae bacterium]